MICYYLFILLKLAGALEFDMETIFKFTDGELHIYIYIQNHLLDPFFGDRCQFSALYVHSGECE